MDPIKDAFLRVKQEIEDLKSQIQHTNRQIDEIKRTLQQIIPTDNSFNTTNQQINPTLQHTPTDNLPEYGLKELYIPSSIGNEGVPTDRQTDRQTDQQTQNPIDFTKFHNDETPEFVNSSTKSDQISQIQRVSDVLESLDSIKKEIRANFKHLTSQEMAVFSAIYTFEEQGFVVDYSLISQKLSLSESSIRDYTLKLIRKKIPIIKSKENNKKVTLQISPELKKIVSLQTILALREL